MNIFLVPDPTAPQGRDAFCRELAKRAPARGHAVEIGATPDAGAAKLVVVNGVQPEIAAAARAAGAPVVVRLVDAPDPEAARRCAESAHRVLVPTRHMHALVASWGVPADRLRLVPYAYERIGTGQIAVVTLRASRPAGFGLLAISALRESDRPGLEIVFSAVARLRVAAHLTVIGDGPALAALKARAEALGLSGKVTFVGGLAQEKALEFLRGAKALVEPDGRQGFPWVALHAMSEGCPVIAAASGSLTELIEDGRNGLLYGDAAGLAEQITVLASTAGLSLTLIKGGVGTIEVRTWDATASAAFDVFEGLGATA